MVRRGRASTRSLATSRTARRVLALSLLAAQCVTGPGCGRTGCVSKLVLLPFYPVLECLGIAPCDLDLLLDRFLVHIGHATTLLPGFGEVGSRGREAARQAIQGPAGSAAAGAPRVRLGQASRRACSGDGGAQGSCNCTRRVSDSGQRSWGLGDGSAAAECWR